MNFKTEFLRFKPECLSLLLLITGYMCKSVCPTTATAGPIIALIPILYSLIHGIHDNKRDACRIDYNTFILPALASAAAFVIGNYTAGTSILLFYSASIKVAESAADFSRWRNQSVLRQTPLRTSVISCGGNAEDCATDNIAPGATIRVKSGRTVPLDSRLLVPEQTSVNVYAITGEPQLMKVSNGQWIPAGAICESNDLILEVLESQSGSTLSRISTHLQKSTSAEYDTHKSRNVAICYMTFISCVAVLLFICPLIMHGHDVFASQWRLSLERAAVLLACSSAVPFMAGLLPGCDSAMGAAARLGIMFKEASIMSNLRKSEVFIFDKTGTITTGEFEVIKIKPTDGHTKEEVLGLDMLLDCYSRHPVAEAISHIAPPSFPGVTVNGYKSVKHGLYGNTNRGELLVGSRKLLKEHGVDIQFKVPDDTEVCVALDGKLIGTILLADTIKVNTKPTLRLLRDMGIKTIGILSGDNEIAVARTSRLVGADFHKSTMSAEDKNRYVSNLISIGRNVVFVGDGIDDASTLASAQTGVTVGALGNARRSGNADVVILGHDLSRMAVAMRISRRLHGVMIENAALALAIYLLVILAGTLFNVSLLLCAPAGFLLTVATCMWTVRSFRYRNFIPE